VGVSAHVPPQPGVPDYEVTKYYSPGPVQYVIEVNAGAASRLGLTDGTYLTFNEALQ